MDSTRLDGPPPSPTDVPSPAPSSVSSQAEQDSEYQLLSPYLVGSLEEVVLPGSVRSLTKGCMGAIFSCRLHNGEQAVLKRSCTKLIVSWVNETHGSINQRWLVREAAVPGYINLFNEALPARALAVATDLSVELAPFRPNAERQMWRFTEEGHLIPRYRESLARGLSSRNPNQGSRLILSEEPGRWTLENAGVSGAVLITSPKGLVIDLSGDHALAELRYLAAWAQPGLVPLRHVVCGQDALASPLVLKRLSKQLGPGTSGQLPDCTLRDIQDGQSRRRTPRQAAQQLINVSRVLASMHADGYTHNDLHSGNILQNGSYSSSRFSVIDLGSTCKADYWKDVLGGAYDEDWCITRDWRTFASHLVSLVDGEPRGLWDLVGTQDVLPFRRTAWAVPPHWSPAARPRSTVGPRARRQWCWDSMSGRIVSQYNGMVLQADRKRSSVILAKDDHTGKSCQTWKVMGKVIQNLETGKCLEVDASGKVTAQKMHGRRSQQWRWESGELLHASGQALDVFGRIRLPQDVHAMSRRFGRRWAELLETFFRPRIDPVEICRKLEALATHGDKAPAPRQLGTRRAPARLARGKAAKTKLASSTSRKRKACRAETGRSKGKKMLRR